MQIQGTLKITDGKAYLTPATGQSFTAEILLIMNIPASGSEAERIDAAQNYLQKILGKKTGDSLSVTGELTPVGNKLVLVITKADA